MPHACGEVTASTALAATAASTALPPARSMARPAWLATSSIVHTMPWGARTLGKGA
jgi:hypothetical protein